MFIINVTGYHFNDTLSPPERGALWCWYIAYIICHTNRILQGSVSTRNINKYMYYKFLASYIGVKHISTNYAIPLEEDQYIL